MMKKLKISLLIQLYYMKMKEMYLCFIQDQREIQNLEKVQEKYLEQKKIMINFT